MRNFRVGYLSNTAIALAIVASMEAAAQPMLEEVIVTATKRAESMQDVPIAISMMSGDKISQQDIQSLEDLAVYMPNVHIAEGGAGDQVFIRGVGS
ncbi:MAG: TonB-dependent receptor plug domain-containing protein, partial [Halieaceae bacterium]|nr:TonB-dependent receptor plug domain-containing protein [Halieaceae bacterium]